jgi:hypothetical protein
MVPFGMGLGGKLIFNLLKNFSEWFCERQKMKKSAIPEFAGF